MYYYSFVFFQSHRTRSTLTKSHSTSVPVTKILLDVLNKSNTRTCKMAPTKKKKDLFLGTAFLLLSGTDIGTCKSARVYRTYRASLLKSTAIEPSRLTSQQLVLGHFFIIFFYSLIYFFIFLSSYFTSYFSFCVHHNRG